MFKVTIDIVELISGFIYYCFSISYPNLYFFAFLLLLLFSFFLTFMFFSVLYDSFLPSLLHVIYVKDF